MEGDLPLDVIVTKVSQNECLNYFWEESSWEPDVAATNQIQIPPTGLINLLANGKNVAFVTTILRHNIMIQVVNFAKFYLSVLWSTAHRTLHRLMNEAKKWEINQCSCH